MDCTMQSRPILSLNLQDKKNVTWGPVYSFLFNLCILLWDLMELKLLWRSWFCFFKGWTQNGISEGYVKQLVLQLFLDWYVFGTLKDSRTYGLFLLQQLLSYRQLLSLKKWDTVTVFTSQKLETHRWWFLSMVSIKWYV